MPLVYYNKWVVVGMELHAGASIVSDYSRACKLELAKAIYTDTCYGYLLTKARSIT